MRANDVDKRQPTNEECEKHAVVHEDEGSLNVAFWHPQHAGYSSRAVVQIGKYTGDMDGGAGCFRVANWHDGEFPMPAEGSESPEITHYCAAEQVIEMGVFILELQAKHEKCGGGETPIRLDTRCLTELRDRISALIDRKGTEAK